MHSLRSRLIAGMLLGMVVLLAAAGVTIYTVQRRQLYRAFEETLLHSANAITLLVRHGPFGYWFDVEGLARLPASQIRQGAVFQIWSDQLIGTPFPRRGDDPDEEDDDFQPGRDDRGPPGSRQSGQQAPPRPPRPPPTFDDQSNEDDRDLGGYVFRSPALEGADLPRLEAPMGKPRFALIKLPDGSPGGAVGLRSEIRGRSPGPRRPPLVTLTVVVAACTAEIDKQLNYLAALLAATALGTMAVSCGVAWLVVSRGLRPFETVAKKIATLDETGLKQRLADHGVPREFEPVVNQLNGLLGRLDEAFERERELTADVAHELRTPVAEIRAITDVTLSRQRDPEEYRQALRETLDTVKTLQVLIEKLLILARLEAGQVLMEPQSVPLKQVIAQQWAQLADRAAAREIQLNDRTSADMSVRADVKLLEVVLANVLNNAVGYAPRGSAIVVESDGDETRRRLRITNDGCELSERDVNKVFARFWRADAARGAGGLHCGLGLTLVRRAMEAMGGGAEAEATVDRRFRLTLTFHHAD